MSDLPQNAVFAAVLTLFGDRQCKLCKESYRPMFVNKIPHKHALVHTVVSCESLNAAACTFLFSAPLGCESLMLNDATIYNLHQ